MNKITYLLLLLSVVSRSQSDATMEKKISLGDSKITIYQEGKSKEDQIIFLNVHQDEITSIETLHAYALIEPIQFFYLKHQETRRVSFLIENKEYSIDPNRIFTKKGRKNTLKDGDAYSKKARKVTKVLAKEITSRIPKGFNVVAVHNNTDENYSIKSYEKGGSEAQNTKAVYVNPELDPDDFIYTTDSEFYEALKKRNVNVILQDNEGYVNDGSLSVYCGKRDIPYVNIETQKGHFDAQMDLMKVVLEVLRK